MLNIVAARTINASESGQADPLQLRVYELSNDALFQQADFLSLYLNDTSTLQDTLIKKRVLPVIQPGDQRTLELELQQATRFIAVLAEFAEFSTAVASAYQPVQPGKRQWMIVNIEENHLRLAPASNDSKH